MRVNEKSIEMITKSLHYIKKLPSGTYFSFAYDGGLQIEASTQADVRLIRSAFRGVIWKKEYVEWSERWAYKAKTRNGLPVRISGVSEGPPQCQLVEVEVIEKQRVPLTYEEKDVIVKRKKYICPEGDKVTAQG
jgi:hypothetical protein